MERKTAVDWTAHIDAYLSSGLSVKKYCKSAGILAHQFKYRYNRYRQKQHETLLAKPNVKPTFATVKMTHPTATQAPFKIVLPNGYVCMVFAPFDSKALEQLLAALSS